MNGYNPRLYYENYNEFFLPVDIFRCLFGIQGDGIYVTYISRYNLGKIGRPFGFNRIIRRNLFEASMFES
jgi:hypothetical protein